MLMLFRRIFFLLLFVGMGHGDLMAQENSLEINPLSLHPVSRSRKLMQRTLWWRVDLKEKQNHSFFARGFEISHIIIQAVKSDLLTPYANDSVMVPMNKKDFLENLKIPDQGGGITEEERALGFTEEDAFGDDDWGDLGSNFSSEEEGSDEFAAQDFSVIEIKEDWFLDKVRSRMYHDIQAITLILPADKNPALFEKPVASFRFIDLVKIFRSMPQKAIWYNAKNNSKHLNMSDAFLLRMFYGNLVKIANPEDDRIIDVYSKSRKQAIIASLQLEHALVEFENQLWEY